MTVSKKNRSLARKASSRCMTCLGGKPEMWRCGAETVDGEWNLCDFGGMYGSCLWFFSVRNRWDLDLMGFSMETMISLGFCKISSKSWSPKTGAVAIAQYAGGHDSETVTVRQFNVRAKKNAIFALRFQATRDGKRLSLCPWKDFDAAVL